MADGGGELDPTVAHLKLCVDQGREVTIEGGGYRLGDDLVVPQVRRGGGSLRSVCVLSLHALPEAHLLAVGSPEQKSCVVSCTRT